MLSLFLSEKSRKYIRQIISQNEKQTKPQSKIHLKEFIQTTTYTDYFYHINYPLS